MPIISVRDNENNRWKWNAKTKTKKKKKKQIQKRTRGTEAMVKRVRAKYSVVHLA